MSLRGVDNLANSLFLNSVSRQRHANHQHRNHHIDGRVLLPDITNKPCRGTKAHKRKGRKSRRSHGDNAKSFDRWLNGVLDKSTKEKMVKQFGYKMSLSPRRGRDSRQVQSAPENISSRSHALFASLSSASSFEGVKYQGSHLKPRLPFLAALLASKGVAECPIHLPTTLLLHRNVVIFSAAGQKLKIFDVGNVPGKVQKQMLLKLLTGGGGGGGGSAGSSDSRGFGGSFGGGGASHPVAVLKRSNVAENSNKTLLIHNAKELEMNLTSLIGGALIGNPEAESACIQKYVKPKGNQSWIVRVVYKHRQDTNTDGFSYVLNDTDPFVTSSKDPATCSIVKSASSKSWSEPRALLDTFLAFAERKLQRKFKMLAGDFLMDGNQKWWFLQVKAFEMRDTIHQPAVAGEARSSKNDSAESGFAPKEGAAAVVDDEDEENVLEHDYEEIQKLKLRRRSTSDCVGEYCHEILSAADKILYPDEAKMHVLAYKDILKTRQIEALLEKNKEKISAMTDMGDGAILKEMLGVEIFSLEKRLLASISQRDRMKLYDPVKVCCSCHLKYSRNKRLLDDATEYEDAAEKIRKTEKKAEREFTSRAVLDARIKGGKGAVCLDDFLQNTKTLLKGGGAEGGAIGGGGVIIDLTRKTDHIEDIERVPTRQRSNWKGSREAREAVPGDAESGGNGEMKDSKDADAVHEEEKGGGGAAAEAQEQENAQRKIRAEAEEAIDGYNPSFDLDIDGIMNVLDAEMDAITLGASDDARDAASKNMLQGQSKSDIPLFRPMSEILVDESQFWTSENYKVRTYACIDIYIYIHIIYIII